MATAGDQIPPKKRSIEEGDSTIVSPQNSPKDPEKVIAKTDLTSDEKQRTWEHFLHEDNLFNDRLNLFLLSNSLLLALVGVLLAAVKINRLVLTLIITIGLLITIAWLYAQAKQYHIINTLNIQVRNDFAEYRWYEDSVKQRNWFRWLHTTATLAYGIPILMASVWVLLLFYQ